MLRPWKLAAQFLDLSLVTSPGIRTRIVERPGRWMQPAEIDELLADLRQVAHSVLPQGELDYGVLTGDQERLEHAVITVLYDRTENRPVAFNALSYMDVLLRGRPASVLHLGLVMVDPGQRSRGMSWVLYGLTCMLLFFRNQLRPLWISNVTQVPAIVGMVADSFAAVFPTPHPEARRTFDHLALAREIMTKHRAVFGVGEDAGFDPERFVITNAYTGGSDHLKKTFEDAPKHRNEVFNQLCADNLDYQRGDDFLQLAQVNLGVARRYLLKSVPRASLPAVLYQVLFVTISSTLLPVLHWLTPNQPLNELRPR